MDLGQSYKLADIIQAVRSDRLDDDFCLYGDDSQPLSLDAVYLLEDYPQLVQEQDLYPESVLSQGLDLVYYGEALQDVVLSVSEQKPEAELDDFLRALVYYYQHDDFLDF